MRKIWVASMILILLAVLIAGCSSGSAATATSSSSSSSSSTADGKTLLESRCAACHSVSRVTKMSGTADEWKSVVDNMINRGAQLTSAEEAVLVDYLAATYK